MLEVHRKPEVDDIGKTEVSAFKEIKPETNMTVSEAKAFIDNLFKEKQGLSKLEKVQIKLETGWSDTVIDHIESKEQHEIYDKAGLHEEIINGRPCLCKEVDMNYIDPKTGMTNRELMAKGRSPIDAKTGERIELHHMGQGYDAPFAELCADSEHGDGNYSKKKKKSEGSWRNNQDLKNQYNNIDRPNHWKAIAEAI